jgi:hypothetical protein
MSGGAGVAPTGTAAWDGDAWADLGPPSHRARAAAGRPVGACVVSARGATLLYWSVCSKRMLQFPRAADACKVHPSRMATRGRGARGPAGWRPGCGCGSDARREGTATVRLSAAVSAGYETGSQAEVS